MALARTHSVALVGVVGHLIEVEADIAQGLPMTILIDAKGRIAAALPGGVDAGALADALEKVPR